CDCGGITVVGSAAELAKLAGKLPEDLHKPWIDEVKIPCKCGKQQVRVMDIMDVWIDAGSASWICLDYPNRNDLFTEMFPADFILEGIDQIRGWFNMLFVASMVGMGKPSFKAVYMHGFINDAQGRKMSKSLGNYILPEEVLVKYGSDVFRYYSIGGTAPGLDLNYNFDDLKVRYRNLDVLWNLHKLVLSSAKPADFSPSVKPKLGLEERYMISVLNTKIKQITEMYDKYFLTSIPNAVEELYLELSRTYIQLVRDKLNAGSAAEKQQVLYVLYRTFMDTLVVFAPVAPFITEKMFLAIKEEFGLKELSVHMCEWPAVHEKEIDTELERRFEVAKAVMQRMLFAREKIGLGVRWPLSEAVIMCKPETKEALVQLEELIKTQTNIRELVFKDTFRTKVSVKADYEKLQPEFGGLAVQIIAHLAMTSGATVMTHLEKDGKFEISVSGAKVAIRREHLIIEKAAPEGYVYVGDGDIDIFVKTELTPGLAAEGYAREIVRKVQALRKKAGLQKEDRIELYVKVDAELKGMLANTDAIKERVGADQLVISELAPSKEYENKADYVVRAKSILVLFSKLDIP
ncbi:MAG: class I tRNA ligase family protein, partial [Candidatus Woesearchaeota archaeon]